jgi:ribosomal-protein-alanine N-acetyltransferase
MIEKIEYLNIDLANQLSKLEFEVFNTFWQPEIIQEKVNNKEFIYWIYKSNVEIVAYLAVQRIDKELHIIGIGVKEEHRNKQIATKLMDTLLQFFRETEVECIRLEVRESNFAAINLYNSYLFEQYGIREKYYQDEDAILFELRKLDVYR